MSVEVYRGRSEEKNEECGDLPGPEEKKKDRSSTVRSHKPRPVHTANRQTGVPHQRVPQVGLRRPAARVRRPTLLCTSSQFFRVPSLLRTLICDLDTELCSRCSRVRMPARDRISNGGCSVSCSGLV